MIRTVTAKLVLLLFFASAGYADVIFTIEHRDNGLEEKSETKVYIKDKMLRMDFMEDEGTPESTMLYNSSKREMVIIDHEDRSYVVMDRESIKKMSEQINQAMAQFEQALKDVPPEQREMMKRMMKDQMPGMGDPAVARPELKRSGSTTVNGYKCDLYDVYANNKKIMQHCITQWSNIEGGEEISAIMLEMASFTDEILKSLTSEAGPLGSAIQFEHNLFKQLEEMNGFPVRTIEYENGSVESESHFKSSKRTAVDSSVFNIPANYRKQTMEMD